MRFGFLLLVFLTAVQLNFAQIITGVVVDTRSAAIPNARVSLINEVTSGINGTTDTEGRFSLSGAITNNSRLTVEARGFAPFERRLSNDGVFDFTIVLQPAALNEEVTVNIAGAATRQHSTPASVVVLSRQAIDQSPTQTIDDLLRQTAGFSLFRRSSSKTSNPTTQGANLRGVSGTGAARTAVMFDGLSLNDAFGGWTYWSRVPMIAVEQVEVLRGGASSLYGSGGLSGAINLAPAKNENSLRFQSSGGSQNTFDAGVAAAYSVDGWRFDLAGEGFTTKGHVPIAEDERGVADTHANSRYYNILAGAERKFGRHDSTNDARVFVRGSLFSDDRNNGTSLTDNSTYFRQAYAGVDAEKSHLGRYQLRAYFQSQVYDQTFSAVSPDRNTETLTRVQRVPSEAAGGSAYWTRTVADHTISSSLDLRRVRGFSEEVGLASGSPTSTNRNGGSERTVSFFVQDIFPIGKRLSLSIGGRVDGWKNYDASSTARSLLTGVVNTLAFDDRSDFVFSPRAAAIVVVKKNLSLYGAYSRSFRAPTLNELYRGFRVGNVVTQANENLSAETADTLEGGVRVSSSSNRISLRGNVFTTAVKDPIVSVTISSTPALITRQRRNVGETRSTGIEVDSEFKPFSKLGIGASYLFVDALITKFPASPELAGRRLPQVARHQLNLQLHYRPDDRWFFGVQSRMSSSQFEDDANSFRLRQYITVDTSSSFRVRKGVELFAAAENIFNNRYDVGRTPVRTVAAPISLRLGLRLDLSKR